MSEGYVHYEDPFATPEALREPVRRLRGRLAAGVTVWTAGRGDQIAGLTISSVLIAEGQPSYLLGLVNDTTSLYEAIEETGSFVVHILDSGQRVLADEFAGLRPSPGGLFERVSVQESEWGPVISPLSNRAFCKLTEISSAGFQQLVRGEIVKIDLDEFEHPLLYWRGRYREMRGDGD